MQKEVKSNDKVQPWSTGTGDTPAGHKEQLYPTSQNSELQLDGIQLHVNYAKPI